MNRLNKINYLIQGRQRLIVFWAIIFYTLVFSLISFWKYYNFGYNALDLAIINQVFYNSSLGNFFASSIHPPTYLNDHFTPLLLILLPFYLLFKQPLTLLILQTIILGLSAWPIYLIGKIVINKNWGLLLALTWLINPFVSNINLFEFHFLPFAVFFIFWAFYFFQNQKFWPFLLFIFLALLAREDVALVVFMFGILAVLEKRRSNWWLTPMVLAVTYFIFALKITHLFSDIDHYKFFIYYSWLGNSWPEFLKNLIFKPWLVVTHLINLGNLEFILGLLLPFAFLPLIKPKYLILGLGIFGQLVLGSAGGSGTLLQIHYSALLLPALFISTIYALQKIINGLGKSRNRIIKLINQEKTLAFLTFLIAIIYSSLTLGPIVGSLVKLAKLGVIWPETIIKNEFVKKIPAQEPVATTYEFLTKLSSRQKISSFNYLFLGKQQFLNKNYFLPPETNYLLIDYQDLITYQLQYGQNFFYQKQYWAAIQNWPKVLAEFGLIEIKDTLALYQKNVADEFILVQISTSQPKINNVQNVSLENKITFLGYNQLNNNHYQFFWQAEKGLEKNYQLQLILKKDKKIVYQKIYPLAYSILPSSLWSAGQIIQTDYWFIPTLRQDQKIPPDNYDLKISLIEIKKGGIELNSIRSTINVIDEQKILGEEISLGQITI